MDLRNNRLVERLREGQVNRFQRSGDIYTLALDIALVKIAEERSNGKAAVRLLDAEAEEGVSWEVYGRALPIRPYLILVQHIDGPGSMPGRAKSGQAQDYEIQAVALADGYLEAAGGQAATPHAVLEAAFFEPADVEV